MNTFSLPKTQHLVVFQEVIRSGSVGAGTKALGLTQPAISKIIDDMESHFGSELIVRRNTGVSLTEVGQVFLNWSEATTREMKNVVNEMNALTNSVVVDVSSGFSSLVGFTFMLEMVHQFKMTFSKAWVSMYETQLSAFSPAICDGRLDFAIGTPSDEMKLQDLRVESLFESEFVLVANRARVGNGTVRLASFQHEQWVLPETNMSYYSELLVTLQRSGICRENIVNTDSVAAIYSLVLNADFLTVIPCDMTTPFGSNQLVTIPVKEASLVARYAAVWSKNYRLRTATTSLVEMAKQYSSGQGNRRWQPIEIA